MVPTYSNWWAPMQPSGKRRVYSAEFKAEVLAECERADASVSAISMARGLNVNLVRKWLVGRGLKRTGLEAPRTVTPRTMVSSEPVQMQFVPVELAMAASTSATGISAGETDIHVELHRGNSRLSVRWPSSQATACAAWLRELAAGALK